MTPEDAEILRYDLLELAAEAEARALAMDFSFLFDPERKLFWIGFNATSGTPDTSYYDLLASEARLASLFALAKGDVPPAHWLHLGRPFDARRGRGDPAVVERHDVRVPDADPPRRHAGGTPLAQSCRAAVARQLEFAREGASPGGSRSRASPRRTRTASTATARSACPAWA